MSNNNDRDNELDQLLKPLSNAKPDDLQMHKWQVAVEGQAQFARSKMSPQIKWAFQLVAATLVGVIIGATAFRNSSSSLNPQNSFAQNNSDDATYEHLSTKLD